MSAPKEKNIPLAIGLNLVLPGLGYMYMGKVVVGIAALLLIIAIYKTCAFAGIFSAWLVISGIKTSQDHDLISRHARSKAY